MAPDYHAAVALYDGGIARGQQRIDRAEPGPRDAVPRDAAPPESDRAQLRERLARLPAAHPSSLAGGADRLDAPVRQQDRPPPASLETAMGGQPDRWSQALPRLTARWEQHLQRWPAGEDDRAGPEQGERGADEPGAWLGDNGGYLSPADNLAADEALDRIARAEPAVTEALQDVATAVPGARLMGLEHHLKGAERFKEKIAQSLAYTAEKSAEEIAGSIPDGLRYTLVFGDDTYSADFYAACSKLQSADYSCVFGRNTWDSEQYVGINTRWLGPGQQVFELQFHTGESFAAKELTHPAYERLRRTTTDPREVRELREFQRSAINEVSIPIRATAIPDRAPTKRDGLND